MTPMHLKVSIYEYWHAGTGRSSGPVFDLEVVRTPAGLPLLPGRTLRGLLREGVQQAEESGLPSVPQGTTRRLFGKPPDGLRSGGDGILRISDATLGADLEAWAAEHPEAVAGSLFSPLAATAIEPGTGQVKEHSLRVLEVTVPLTLRATVHMIEPEADAAKALRDGLGFLRALGSHRRRGLGRARFELEET